MADTWSDWREVTEQYESIEGFAKQVKRIPASMDLSTLPEGYGLCFELRIEDTTADTSAPILDRVETVSGMIGRKDDEAVRRSHSLGSSLFAGLAGVSGGHPAGGVTAAQWALGTVSKTVSKCPLVA